MRTMRTPSRDVLPIAVADAHAVGEMQVIVIGTQVDPGDLLAVSGPLQDARPAGPQAAFAMQPVHVERTASFHFGATRSAWPSRSEAAHHAAPFFAKSFGNSLGAANPRRPEEIGRLSVAMLMPRPPTGAVQPGMACAVGAKRQEHIVPALSAAAPAAAVRRRTDRVAVEPLDDTGPESACLSLSARKPAVEFGDRRPLVEKRLPVLGQPAAAIRLQEADHFTLVAREGV